MKKGLVIVLAILAVFAMVSCKNDPVASDGANIFVKGGLIFVEFDEPQEIALALDYNDDLFWQNAGEFILGEDGLPILKDNMEDDPDDLNHYYAKDAYLVLEQDLETHYLLYSLGSSTLFVVNADDIFDDSMVVQYNKDWGLSCKASLYYNGGKSLTIQTIEMTDVAEIEATFYFETDDDRYTGDVVVAFDGLGDGEYQFSTDGDYWIPVVEGKPYVINFADLLNISVKGYKDGKLNSKISVFPDFDGDIPSLEPSKIKARLTDDTAKKFVLVEAEEMALDHTYKIDGEPELDGLMTYSIKIEAIDYNIATEGGVKQERTAVALLGGLEGEKLGIDFTYTARLYNRDLHDWEYDVTAALRYNTEDMTEKQTPLFTKALAEDLKTLPTFDEKKHDLVKIQVVGTIRGTAITVIADDIYFYLDYTPIN